MSQAPQRVDHLEDEGIDPDVRYECEVDVAVSILKKDTAVGLVVVGHLVDTLAKRKAPARSGSKTPTPMPINSGASVAPGKDESCPPEISAQSSPMEAEDVDPQKLVEAERKGEQLADRLYSLPPRQGRRQT